MGLVKISGLTEASTVNGAEDHIFNQNGNTRRGKVPITTVTARQMGAVLDGVTDDSAAIQELLDYPDDYTSGVHAVHLVIDGPALINAPLLLRRKTGKLTMPGWGSSTATPKGPYLKSGPAMAGQPMLTVQEMWGGEIDGMRFIGNSAAKPSAALYFNMGVGTNSNTWSTIRRLWIGGLWGYDSDDAEQFTTGILLDGVNQNNDMMHWENIVIHRAATGIKFAQSQMGYHFLQNFTTEYCGIGIHTNADIGGSNVHLMNSTQYDLKLGDGAQVNFSQYVSEGSAALADMTGPGQMSLTMKGGYWQAGSNIRGDGVILNGLQQFPVEVGLDDFSLTLAGGYSGPTPKIVLKSPPANASRKYLRLINPSGILAANIDMTTQIAGDVRVVKIERSATEGNNYIQTQNIYGYPEDLNEHRFDFISTTLRQKDETSSGTTASTNEISSERGTEVGVAVNNEVGKWNFVVAPSRYNIGRISCRVGPLWTDSGNLLFWTKESGASIQEVMRLHNVAADGETMATLLTNNGGSQQLRRVLVGPADSGGAGYRYLRVAN